MSSIATVLVTNRIHPDVRDVLQCRFRVIVNEADRPWPLPELLARCQDANALLAFMTDWIADDFLAGCARLKIVAGALKGWDNFDVDALTRRGIWLTVVPDLLTDPTAELAIGLMIGLARNVKQGDAAVRSRAFTGWRPWFYGNSLNRARVGIVGMGAVGQAIAERLAGFSVELSYSDERPLPAEAERRLNCSRLELDALVTACDFVVLAAPLSRDTYHLIDRERLRRFGRQSYLVNVSRGSLVCEEAVRDALKNRSLAGYAADVFEFEDWAIDCRPSGIDAELLSLQDQTLFTPHLGSAVRSVRRAIEMEAALNIVDLAEGRRPRGAVNHPVGA